MNENRNDTAKWLQYLLYVGIAPLVNSLLGIFGLPGLGWILFACNAAAVYLLLQLAGSNPRYKTAAIFYAVSLAGSLIGNVFLNLAISVCSIIGQYQEYHAHGELIAARDSKLSDNWNTLFGMQIALSVIAVLLTGLVAGILAALTNMSVDAVTPIVTVLVAVLSAGLRALYLVYLSRTVKLLAAEASI